MGFPYFGQPAIFGEPFGMDSGGAAPTLADFVESLVQQASGLGGWQRMQNTSLRVSTNAFGVINGTQLLPNDFSGGDFTGWNDVLTPTKEIVNDGGVNKAHITTNQTGEGIRSNTFGSVGNTYELTCMLTVTSVTGGNVRVLLANSLDNQLVQFNTPGTYAVTVRGLSTGGLRAQFDTPGASAAEFYVWQPVLRQVGEYDGQASASVTFGQTDYKGAANEAFDFNGSAGMVTVNDPDFDGLTSLAMWGTFTPETITANRRLFYKNGEFDIFMNGDGTISGTVNYSTTNATRTTSTTISAGAAVDIGFEIGEDRVLHLYIDGTEAEYASSQAGDGTRTSTTNDMQLGKDGSTNGFDGAIADWLYVAVTIGADGFAQLHDLADLP